MYMQSWTKTYKVQKIYMIVTERLRALYNNVMKQWYRYIYVGVIYYTRGVFFLYLDLVK